MLLARLATKEAKPNGQRALGLLSGPAHPKLDSDPSEEPHPQDQVAEEVKQFLAELPLSQLPGVGYKLEKKLKAKNLLTCGDILSVRKESLKVCLSYVCLPSIALIALLWFPFMNSMFFFFAVPLLLAKLYLTSFLLLLLLHPLPTPIQYLLSKLGYQIVHPITIRNCSVLWLFVLRSGSA
jgi:IMS family HHH motif